MLNVDAVFEKLPTSKFRSRFFLPARERGYLQNKGFETVEQHAHKFIAERLAPAQPHNDGSQTPFRGHPVFIAQHATATCCRSCLEKWHKIAKGKDLTVEEQSHVVSCIMRWLSAQKN